MRVAMISGAVLAAVGAFLLVIGVSYTREESFFKLGGIEAKVQKEHRVPDWIGGIALGAGLVLFVVGLKKR